MREVFNYAFGVIFVSDIFRGQNQSIKGLGSEMSRILKEYDKNIFDISEHFIKVEFPFSLSKDNNIIAIIIANGDDNLEMMEALKILEGNFYMEK